MTTSFHGWHPLPDGREGLSIEGVCYASIEHRPEQESPWKTESLNPSGWRSLRNLDTREDAIAHCERVTRFVARRTP